MNNDIAMIAAWLQNISDCILNPVDDFVPFIDCDTTGGDWGAMQGSIPVQSQGCAGTVALTISVSAAVYDLHIVLTPMPGRSQETLLYGGELGYSGES